MCRAYLQSWCALFFMLLTFKGRGILHLVIGVDTAPFTSCASTLK